ncbi:cora-like Mg2+ transporter protein-domain-containing protein [Phyllosticta citribraziliensis]|uniref:Cora-like Mg2+ transporter protein-domain-containing protein n=1 Tax=Phyllosticta citribraziliensis TaxID=989973 RepID=A0ABR1L318_9PEZI
MSPNSDPELGLRNQSSSGPDPDEEQKQTAGDQEHTERGHTDQDRANHQFSSIKLPSDDYSGASDAGNPKAWIFEYVKSQHGKVDLHTTSFQSSSEWTHQLDTANVKETSNAAEIQENLHLLLLRGQPPERCLETFLQTRRVPQEEIKALCAIVVDPPLSIIERSADDCFHLGWKNIPFILTRTAFGIDDLLGDMIKAGRTENTQDFYRFLNTPCPLSYEHIWCFWISNIVVLVTTEFQRPRFTTIAQRLASDLAQLNTQTPSKSKLIRFIQEETCQSVLDYECEILTHIEKELEKIDVEMGLPNMGVPDVGFLFKARDTREFLQLKMALLKKNMGEWRSHILSRHNLQRQIERIIKRSGTPGGIPSQQQDALDDFNSKLDGTLRHFESTFTALIGTMSINESTRAIREAEEVTKLTQLASFFVPLSFVVGLFGMNLEELANLSIWVWAVTSIVLLSITILVLYPRRTIKILKIAFITLTIPIWLLPTSCFIIGRSGGLDVFGLGEVGRVLELISVLQTLYFSIKRDLRNL